MLRFGSSEALNFVGLWKKLTIWTASPSLNSSTEKWINLNNFSAWNVCSHYLKCSEVWLPSQLFQVLFQLKKVKSQIFCSHVHKSFEPMWSMWHFHIVHMPACAKRFPGSGHRCAQRFPGRRHGGACRDIAATDFRMDLKTFPWHFWSIQSMGQIWYTYEWKPIEINH